VGRRTACALNVADLPAGVEGRLTTAGEGLVHLRAGALYARLHDRTDGLGLDGGEGRFGFGAGGFDGGVE
jgi:hypothetical protein